LSRTRRSRSALALGARLEQLSGHLIKLANFAGAAMALSAVSVVANALRLNRVKL
jgi:cation transport ATPase